MVPGGLNLLSHRHIDANESLKDVKEICLVTMLIPIGLTRCRKILLQYGKLDRNDKNKVNRYRIANNTHFLDG
jgi:hypothetical protein